MVTGLLGVIFFIMMGMLLLGLLTRQGGVDQNAPLKGEHQSHGS
jgi:hypothetical protein